MRMEIELFFLPVYSPTLNLDEYLNRNLKTELHLQTAGTHDDNLELTRAFMNCEPDRNRAAKNQSSKLLRT